MHPEEKLKELGISLFTDIRPIGTYVPFSVSGNLIWISGQGPSEEGEYRRYFGKVGESISKEEAYAAARQTGINLISILKLALGDLNRVKRIIHVRGYVSSTADFMEQPSVINGVSDLLTEVFGEAGKHSRCAVSVPSLPLGICVEAELVAKFEVEEEKS